jgi:hypothetical protein
MPVNPLNHNPASGIFKTQPLRKSRRGSRDVVPGESKERESGGPAVGYAEKDEAYYRILEIYGPQDAKGKSGG